MRLWQEYAHEWTERLERAVNRASSDSASIEALVVRYEDLQTDCSRNLKTVVQFLRRGYSAGTSSSVEAAAAGNLKDATRLARLRCACEGASREQTHRSPRSYRATDVFSNEFSVDMMQPSPSGNSMSD
jgi:hypothetical protein